MSGYQESVTDPSYRGQIIVFTYPLIGNYGVAADHMESDAVHARAVVMREGVDREDAPHAEGGWLTWLADCGIPALTGVDTRALVRHIRDKGAMRGGVFPGEMPEAEARERVLAEPPMAGADLAREVTPREPVTLEPLAGVGDGPLIVGIDTGIKDSIVRNLRERGARLELHPCTASADDIRARNPDAVFLANGPGDPAALDYVVDTVRELVGEVPVWGICLGHQLLCRAVGLETFKLPFGHRGANHPGQGPRDRQDRDHEPEPRLRGARPERGEDDRRRRGDALGDRLRRRRAVAAQPLRPHGRGARAEGRAGLHRPVPPRGRAGPARRAAPLRPLPGGVGSVMTATEQELEVVRAAVTDSFGKQALEGGMFDEWFHPDFEWIPIAVHALGGDPYRGREGFEEYWALTREIFEEFEVTPESIEPVGEDSVLVIAAFRIKGRQGQVDVTQDVAVHFRLRDGRIAYARGYTTPDEGREAAGA